MLSTMLKVSNKPYCLIFVVLIISFVLIGEFKKKSIILYKGNNDCFVLGHKNKTIEKKSQQKNLY
jgi:hypothetical protein